MGYRGKDNDEEQENLQFGLLGGSAAIRLWRILYVKMCR